MAPIAKIDMSNYTCTSAVGTLEQIIIDNEEELLFGFYNIQSKLTQILNNNKACKK